jgi:hypothetical protein
LSQVPSPRKKVILEDLVSFLFPSFYRVCYMVGKGEFLSFFKSS